MEMGKPSKSGLVEDGRENTVREKAGLTEGWGRAKMVKAGYFRQSSSEWGRGSDRSNVARAINQKDELNSFSSSPEAERRDMFGKPGRSLNNV